jgi:outer membrane protein assembly factor BamB
VVEVDTRSGTVVRDLDVGPDPLLAVPAAGSVWTLNLDDGTMSRIDVASGVVTPFEVGVGVGLASDGADLWLAHDDRFLARVDGHDGAILQTIPLGDRPLFALRNAGFPVVADGEVWITIPRLDAPDAPQALWRVDTDRGAIGARVSIGVDPLPPVAAYGAIWLSTRDGVVYRVDLDTLAITTVEVGALLGPVTAGGGRVWVSSAGAIHELDRATGRVRMTLTVPGAARGMVWMNGSIWVATSTGVEAVDPDTGSVAAEIELAEPSADEGPIGLVPVDTSLWVSIETH